MTARHLADIKPALLVWARATAGYSLEEASEKIGVSADKLAAAESGKDKLTVPQLRQAANVYKRPLAAFFLPEPPEVQELAHDFRRSGAAPSPPRSPALRLEMRQAEDRRDEALLLARDLGRRVRAFSVQATQTEDAEAVGHRVRKLLRITEDAQRSWRSPGKALRAWKGAVEGLDVLVFQTSTVPLTEMRGFTLFEKLFPVITLNGKDAEAGRIFTLLHEFTHLLLTQGALCDPLQEFNGKNAESRVEAFCNHVAGAAIAPLELIQRLAPSDVGTDEWTHEQLKVIARELSSSKEVVLRRLVILGRASQRLYARMRREFLDEYAELEKKRKRETVIVPRERLIARNLGQTFIGLVFAAYGSDKISARSLSEHLGVKLNHLQKLEAEVFGKESA